MMQQPVHLDENQNSDWPDYKWLRAAYENLPQPAWAIDLGGRYIFQNRLDREAFGDLTGKRPEETGIPKEQAKLWEHMHSRVLSGETVTFLAEIETSRGRIFSKASLVPLMLDDQIAGAIGMALDQTALVLAERQQAAAQTRLETLLALSSDWLWETDADHRLSKILGDNGQLAREFPDWTGCELWDIEEHGADAAEARPNLRDHMKQRLSLPERVCQIRKLDGTSAYFEIRGEPRFDDVGDFLGYWGVGRDVTHREAMARRLRFADQIITATKTPAIVCNADGLIEWVNPAFEQITEYQAAEVIGRKPGSFLQCSDTDPSTVKRLGAAIRAGQAARETILNQSKSGRKYWLDIEIRPLHSKTGELTGFMAIEADVTDLFESRQRLKELVENVAAGIVIHGKSGDIIASNPEACRLLHMSEAQMKGKEIMDPSWGTVFADGKPMSGEEMPSTIALRTGQSVKGQIIGIKRPDGGIQWLRVNARVSSAAHATDREVIASFVDITVEEDRKRELEDAKALLRDVVETIPDAVVAFDRDDRLIFCNDAYRSYYSESAPAIQKGAKFKDVLVHGLGRGLYADAGKTKAEQEQWLSERLLAHKHPSSVLIQKLSDGRWLQIKERVSDAGVNVGVRTDVTSLKQAEEEIRRIADTDSLTGAANRNVMIRELSRRTGAPTNIGDTALFGILDIDHFKSINDTYGHDVGDLLLKEITARLELFVGRRDGGIVARLGGDEFAFLLPGSNDPDTPEPDLDHFHASLCKPARLGTSILNFSVSLGVARVRADGDSATEVFKSADLALYQAKTSGRNGWQRYNAEFRRRVERRQTLAEALKLAIETDQIRVAYQPQVDSSTGALTGFEALARWTHDGIAIPPDEFVSIAEDVGLGIALGCAIIKKACHEFAGFIRDGVEPGRLAINLSTSQIRDATFPDRVAKQLDKFEVLRGRLEFEITENVLLDGDVEEIVANINRLHKCGVMLSLDDFGTGFGSLTHLLRFPIGKLKIDKSFVQSIEASKNAATIVRTTVVLAHSLGMNVVAEGVETPEQCNFLREIGCDNLQGYLISKPTSLSEAFKAARRVALLNEHTWTI